MAEAAGAHFTFEWDAGDTRTSPIRPTETYPGDAAVGVVATDAFDTGYRNLPATAQWTALLGRPVWAGLDGRVLGGASQVDGPGHVGCGAGRRRGRG